MSTDKNARSSFKNKGEKTSYNIDGYIEKLLNFQILAENEVKEVCKLSQEILANENNIVEVTTPVTICGDIHGQYSDLLELFKIGGKIPDTSYLFLGDYVDRGYKSVETISLLLCYKIRYPKRVFLTRGNHECRKVTQVYGFHDECLKKYGNNLVWKAFTEVFDVLPLCAMIDSNVILYFRFFVFTEDLVLKLKQ